MHVLYPELMVSMTNDDGKKGWSQLKVSALQIQIIKFKRLLVKSFYEHCNCGLFTPEFHLLGHVVMVRDLREFGTLAVLDALPLDH